MTETTSEQTYRSGEPGGWAALGIPAAEAQAWARAGYQPGEAIDWREAGALDPGTAAHWERHGFTAATAQAWLSIGEVGPADAITMTTAAMTPDDCARIRARDPRCLSDPRSTRELPDQRAGVQVQAAPTAIGW